jgi:hypothetical protein
LPVEVIFNPNWWFRNYGISFDRPFYFDREVRIENDIAMRRALFARFGLGHPYPRPRPVIGSQFVAGGFVVPALLGVDVRFEKNQAPCPVSANLKPEQIMALRVPDVDSTWPMNVWIAQMDALERDFGFVIGDFNTDGVINTALLRGDGNSGARGRVRAWPHGHLFGGGEPWHRERGFGHLSARQLLRANDFPGPVPPDAASV